MNSAIAPLPFAIHDRPAVFAEGVFHGSELEQTEGAATKPRSDLPEDHGRSECKAYCQCKAGQKGRKHGKEHCRDYGVEQPFCCPIWTHENPLDLVAIQLQALQRFAAKGRVRNRKWSSGTEAPGDLGEVVNADGESFCCRNDLIPQSPGNLRGRDRDDDPLDGDPAQRKRLHGRSQILLSTEDVVAE